jgi:hypothetical protein
MDNDIFSAKTAAGRLDSKWVAEYMKEVGEVHVMGIPLTDLTLEELMAVVVHQQYLLGFKNREPSEPST